MAGIDGLFELAASQPVPSHAGGFFEQPSPAMPTLPLRALAGKLVTVWSVYPAYLVYGEDALERGWVAVAVVTLVDSSVRDVVALGEGGISKVILAAAERLCLPVRLDVLALGEGAEPVPAGEGESLPRRLLRGF